MSNTDTCQPVNPAVHPVTVSRAMHAVAVNPAVEPVTGSRAIHSVAVHPAVEPVTGSRAMHSVAVHPAIEPVTGSRAMHTVAVHPAIEPVTGSRAIHAVAASRLCSSTATHVTGRSPSLLAMERVMPKYASAASSLDMNVARWHCVRDRHAVASNEFSAPDALMPTDCSAGGSQCTNASALPVHLSPAAAGAGGGRLGSVSSARMLPLTSNSYATVNMSDGASVRSAKDQLRAHLSHLPASNSASCDVSQVGKAACMIDTFTTLAILSH